MKISPFIISFFLLISVTAFPQDLNVEQTLAYINKQLNEKDNKFNAGLYGHKHFNEWVDNYLYEVKIELGVLIVTKYFLNHYLTGNINPVTHLSETRNFTAFIEELSIPIRAIDNDFDYSSAPDYLCGMKPARLSIPRKNMGNYSIIKTTKKYNRYGIEQQKKTEKNLDFIIEFSNENLLCTKLRNALTHLINLASKDPRYYTLSMPIDNDPFATPAQKDTISSAAINTTNSNSIPMTKVGGVYEIPIIINGVLKLSFIFDAGASDVSISPDVAFTLIRTGTVTDKDFLGTQTYKFADGSTAKSKVFMIKEIQLGNKKVNNIKASISNSIEAPLLLGQSALNKFGKVTIDYSKGVIIFQD